MRLVFYCLFEVVPIKRNVDVKIVDFSIPPLVKEIPRVAIPVFVVCLKKHVDIYGASPLLVVAV